MKLAGKRLGWDTISGIETLSGICLMALLWATALHFVTIAASKARLVNIWSDFRSQRAELVEQLALNGDGFALHSASPSAVQTESAVTDDIEAALAFRRTIRVKPAVPDDAASAQEKPRSSPIGNKFAKDLLAGAQKHAEAVGTNFNVVIVDRTVLIGMELNSERESYFLAISPATIGQGLPGSLLWLCGQRQPPPGWERLPGPTGSDLPQNLLFSVCR